jgi:hypothetical protein
VPAATAAREAGVVLLVKSWTAILSAAKATNAGMTLFLGDRTGRLASGFALEGFVCAVQEILEIGVAGHVVRSIWGGFDAGMIYHYRRRSTGNRIKYQFLFLQELSQKKEFFQLKELGRRENSTDTTEFFHIFTSAGFVKNMAKKVNEINVLYIIIYITIKLVI